jgi:hypothetical protein
MQLKQPDSVDVVLEDFDGSVTSDVVRLPNVVSRLRDSSGCDLV